MTPTYHLEVYKPESATYCRSCLMDRWSGDRELMPQLSRETLIEYAVKYMLKPMDQGETGYDITVFAGDQIYEISEGEWLSQCDDPEDAWWDSQNHTPEEEAYARQQMQIRADLETIRMEILQQIQAHQIVRALK